MSQEYARRYSGAPFAAPGSIPSAPPLPAPKPLQRARDAANRFFGYSSRPASPQEEARYIGSARFATLGASQDATASHKTGLEIHTIAINEKGTHALLGGKEIFKTVKVEDGVCAEELNLRSAIRSTPTQASGKARQNYSIDIADVAWGKGDCGDYVAAATSSGKIILYDLGHAGLQAAQLHEHFRQVHKVTFNPHHRGSLLLSGSQDGTVRLWDVRDVRRASTLQSKRKYSGQSDGVRDVKWSPTEGVDFAFGTDSGWIQRWDIRNLKTAKVKIPAHITTCNSIDWHPDGKHIVSASNDKSLRVWDFSTNRRQKASWEIKTPYPVLNARWRPSCESSMPNDYGARHCTQLCTAYDGEHPVLHVWDFRRPALPFREIIPYSTAPTDFLWHSQDLLWTVGKEGVFLQTDIQHAAKVIDKRNLQAFGIGPQGDINFVTQKRRKQPRVPKVPSITSKTSSLSQSPEHGFLSRSSADDSLDHSFLSTLPPKRNRHSRNNTRSESISMDLSKGQNVKPTLALGDILLDRQSFRPQQIAIRGSLAEIGNTHVFKHLASHYIVDIEPILHETDFIRAFDHMMEHNAGVAEAVGQYQLAQTWRIVKFAFDNHLQARAEHKQRPKYDKTEHLYLPQTRDEDLEQDKPFTLVEMLKELVAFYSHAGDAQTAAHFVLLLGPLLPRTHPLSFEDAAAIADVWRERWMSRDDSAKEDIERLLNDHLGPLMSSGLPLFQIEAVLSTYHTQLTMQKLVCEAALLRRLCYPVYPDVYGAASEGNTAGIRHNLKQMEICPVCKCKVSPLERCGDGAESIAKVLTSCVRCGHSMHFVCSTVWALECSGLCPTEGCLCDSR